MLHSKEAEDVMLQNQDTCDVLAKVKVAVESWMGIDILSIDDNIFEAGLDSLGTAGIMGHLQMSFPNLFRMPGSMLFDFPTIRLLSEAIAERLSQPAAEELTSFSTTAFAATGTSEVLLKEVPFTQYMSDAETKPATDVLYKQITPQSFQRSTDGMECFLIPGGQVWIGDGLGDRAALPNEKPCHKVILSSFLIDVEPVSVGAFARFLNQTKPPSHVLSEWCLLREGDQRSDYIPLLQSSSGLWEPRSGVPESWPMIMVSWFGANAYSLWANGHDWKDYAQAEFGFLPTEAQWEYAARGAEVVNFPWGDQPASPSLLNVCWDMDALRAETALQDLPIASVNVQLGVSQLGLRHIAGNVWQWCRDTYDPAFYSSAAASLPDAWNSAKQGPKSERGGSWVGPAYLARSSYRRGRSGLAKGRCLGFRCVGNAKLLKELHDVSSADVSTTVSEDLSADEPE